MFVIIIRYFNIKIVKILVIVLILLIIDMSHQVLHFKQIKDANCIWILLVVIRRKIAMTTDEKYVCNEILGYIQSYTA